MLLVYTLLFVAEETKVKLTRLSSMFLLFPGIIQLLFICFSVNYDVNG